MKTRPQFIPTFLAAALGFGLFTFTALSQQVAPPSPTRQEAPTTIDNRPPTPQALGTSAAAFTNSMDVLNDTVKLGTGDRVSLRIVEEKEKKEPYSLFVSESGDMEIPHIGRIIALDKTCKQLAYEIKPLLERDYFKRATVIVGLDAVGTRSRGKVYLTGQIRTPGVLDLMPGEPTTLTQAILRANGVGDFADKRAIRLVRRKDGLPAATPEMLRATQPQKKSFWKKTADLFRRSKPEVNPATDTFIINLVDIIEKGHLERDPVLKPGDMIYVPEKLINY